MERDPLSVLDYENEVHFVPDQLEGRRYSWKPTRVRRLLWTAISLVVTLATTGTALVSM